MRHKVGKFIKLDKATELIGVELVEQLDFGVAAVEYQKKIFFFQIVQYKLYNNSMWMYKEDLFG